MQVFRKGSMIVVLLSVAALLFAGCGSGGGGGAAAPSAPAPSATGSFQLTNNSNFDINQVNVSPSSSSSWGSPQNTDSILAHSQWTLGSIPIGTYDTRAVIIGSVSTYYSYLFDFSIIADTTFTAAVSDSGFTGTLIVSNTNTTNPITALYVSTTAFGAGGDQLSSNVAPGTSRQLTNLPPGSYYVRVVQGGVNRDNSGVSIGSISYTTITYN